MYRFESVSSPVRRRARCAATFRSCSERVNGRPLIWLDNAATTQKPQSVIDRLSYFYEHENSNIHRAAHELAARATDAYEDAREKVAPLPQCVFARRRSSLCAAPPRPSIWSRRAGDASISTRTTRSSSPGSSITPTSFPGRCCARKRARACAWLRSTTTARSCSTNTRSCWARRRGWCPSRRFRTRWAPSLPRSR